MTTLPELYQCCRDMFVKRIVVLRSSGLAFAVLGFPLVIPLIVIMAVAAVQVVAIVVLASFGVVWRPAI
jgi:hypothetical protein